MKPKLTFFIIILLAAANVYLLNENLFPKQNEVPVQNTCQPAMDLMKEQFNSYLGSLMALKIRTENHKLPDSLTFTSSDGVCRTIGALIIDSPKMIVDFQRIYCQVCITKELSMLLNLSKSIGAENIIVLYDFSNTRERITFEKNNSLLTYELNFQPDESSYYQDLPMIYVVSEDMKIRDLYVPHQDTPDISREYYSNISEKYF